MSWRTQAAGRPASWRSGPDVGPYCICAKLTVATGIMDEVEFVFTPDKLPLPTVAGTYRLDAALMHKGEAMLSVELVELSVLPGPPRALRLADSCAAAYAEPWRTRVLTVEEVHAGAQGLAALEGHILDRWAARIQYIL